MFVFKKFLLLTAFSALIASEILFQEFELEYLMNDLATKIAPMYKVMAPNAFHNHIKGEPSVADECRIGWGKERPFSGVTACLDFCAHNHKDIHNMDGGATVIVTLKKPSRGDSEWININDDQYHVLPGYSLFENTNFSVTANGMLDDEKDEGSIQVLNKFPQKKRLRKSLVGSCKERKQESAALLASSKHARTSKSNQNVSYPYFKTGNHADMNFSIMNQANESSFSCESKKIVKHTNERDEVIYEFDSENEDAFENEKGTGIALALSHGSLLIECARLETHASTAINNPNRLNPSRLSLVFYQHKNLKKPSHGKLDIRHKENWTSATRKTGHPPQGKLDV